MDNTIKDNERFGWQVNPWCAAVGISRSTAYELIAEGKIASVAVGKRRIITTHPRDFLASLQSAA